MQFIEIPIPSPTPSPSCLVNLTLVSKITSLKRNNIQYAVFHLPAGQQVISDLEYEYVKAQFAAPDAS